MRNRVLFRREIRDNRVVQQRPAAGAARPRPLTRSAASKREGGILPFTGASLLGFAVAAALGLIGTGLTILTISRAKR